MSRFISYVVGKNRLLACLLLSGILGCSGGDYGTGENDQPDPGLDAAGQTDSAPTAE